MISLDRLYFSLKSGGGVPPPAQMFLVFSRVLDEGFASPPSLSGFFFRLSILYAEILVLSNCCDVLRVSVVCCKCLGYSCKHSVFAWKQSYFAERSHVRQRAEYWKVHVTGKVSYSSVQRHDQQ